MWEVLLYTVTGTWTALLLLWQALMGGMAVVVVLPFVVFTIEELAMGRASGHVADEPPAAEPDVAPRAAA